MTRLSTVLALGFAVWGGCAPTDPGADPAFDLCAYIDAHTPDDAEPADPVTVYCQTSTDCGAGEKVETTETVLEAAQAACAAYDELDAWERLPGECDDGATDAVRCWRLD